MVHSLAISEALNDQAVHAARVNHKLPSPLARGPVAAYWLNRSCCPGLLFAGVTPAEVAETLRLELADDRDLSADMRDVFTITSHMTTFEEIRNLPEFQY